MRGARLLVLVGIAELAACSDCGDPRLEPARVLLSASPARLDFGEVFVGQSVSVDLTLASRGNLPATLTGLTLDGAGFRIDDAPSWPAVVDGERVLKLGFAPLTSGPASGTLTVRYDGTAATLLEVPLGGVGASSPTCPDLGPCVAVTFDPTSGGCTEALLEGDCDDQNACTTGDTCVQGSCVGSLVTCSPNNHPCEVATCDATLGCRIEPVDDLCADDDPCTVDRCTPGGCESTVADDGTPCAEADCTTFALCFAGVCETSTTPDGFPCSDDDSCTEADACSAGTCAGTSVVGEAEIRGAAFTFGAVRGSAVRIGDRVVVRDVYDTESNGIMTVLDLEASSLTVIHRRLDAELQGHAPAFAALRPGALAFLDWQGTLWLYDVGASAEPVLRSAPTLFSPLQMGVPATPRLVGGGGILLAARSGDPSLVMLYEASPEEHLIPSVIPLPSPPVDFALGDSGTLYVSLGTGELFGVYLYADAFPPPVFPVRAGLHSLVAASGDLVAVAHADADGFVSQPTIVDLFREDDTANTLGSLELISSMFSFDSVADIALSGHRLAVLVENSLRLYDVSDPASPLQLDAVQHDGIHPSYSANTLALDDELLIVSSPLAWGSGVRFFDVTNDALAEIHHPEQGSVLELVRAPEWAGLHRHSVRFLDVSDPSSPVITGAALRGAGDRVAIELPAEGPGARFPIDHRPGGTFVGSIPLPVVTPVSGALVPIGAWTTPFELGVLSVKSDGATAYAVRMSNDDDAFFEVYAFDEADEGGPPLVASLPLALPAADRNNWTELELDGTRVAALMQHDWGFDTPAEQLATDLLLVDVATPSAPLVVASGTLPGLHRGPIPVGDDLLFSVARVSGWYNTDYEGEMVVRIARDGDILQSDALYPVDRASRVVWANEDRVAVATERGLSFFRHGAGTLEPIGELALPAAPTDAELEEGVLVVATGLGVVAVGLPCP